MARKALGEKAPPEAIAQWKHEPRLRPAARLEPAERPPTRMLADHFRRMLTFDFGRSDADDTPIAQRLREGVGPSLVAHGAARSCSGCRSRSRSALLVAFFRETYIDRTGVVLCVLVMSVSIAALHHRRAVSCSARCCAGSRSPASTRRRR